jgi:phage shock protein C
MQVNRLYRCRHDRRLAGVASGMAEFFGLDPTLVRVLWFLSIFLGGFTILLYLALAIIVPLEPATGDDALDDTTVQGAGHRHASHGSGQATTLAGVVLILIGSVALLDAVLPAWVDTGRYAWPVLLVGIGAVLVVGALRRRPSDL